MRMKTRMATALAAFLLAAAHLHAAAECRLTGVVIDSADAPIDGVTITLSTPGLSSFRQTLKTDEKGHYLTLIPDCTMPYHAKFEKEGFIASEADKKIPIKTTGTLDMRLQRVVEAQASAVPAAAAPPPTAQAVMAFNAGVEAMNAGDKATAESKFQEAVKKNPDLPAGWQALMQLAYGKQEWAKVIEYGTKATDLDPTQTDLYQTMSEAAAKIGDTKAAAEWKARYADANPDSPEILYNKGIDFYNKGKMKDAEATLSKTVAADPDFANAHFWLGMAAFNLNKKATAKEHLQKYLELDPSGKEAATAKEILPLLK